MGRSEHDQKGERLSASSLPAVSIRLLTADGYQREHVDSNTSDPTPVRGQIGGEKAPQDQDATDPLADYVLDYALGVMCGCLEVNINFKYSPRPPVTWCFNIGYFLIKCMPM